MSSDSPNQLREFASRYTEAWCSHDAARVASFFSANGSLVINGGEPAVGRNAITQDGLHYRLSGFESLDG